MKRFVYMVLTGLFLGVIAGRGATPCAELSQVEGSVRVRNAATKKLEPVEAGHPLGWGDVLVTGDASRYEVSPAAGGGLWRVGRRAVFMLKEGGARVLAGTALVQVPPSAMWRVESRRSIVALPEGSWLVQAVDNKGMKIVCLEGSKPVQAWGDAAGAGEPEAAATLEIKPGQLTFLQPGGKSFSPLVTIYLAETLATSRLVNGFPRELPGRRRITLQALAQEERLKSLSNAVVKGATEAGGFQIAVPTPPAPVDQAGGRP